MPLRDDLHIENDPAFMAKRALDFANLVGRQAEPVYERMGMTFPVIASSTLLCILQAGSASQVEIARNLNIPHQSAGQKLAILRKLGLVSLSSDPRDARRKPYVLTEFGKAQGDILIAYREAAAEVFTSLSHQIGVDLLDALNRAVAALEGQPLTVRFPIPDEKVSTS